MFEDGLFVLQQSEILGVETLRWDFLDYLDYLNDLYSINRVMF
jgi:hypothetical protein